MSLGRAVVDTMKNIGKNAAQDTLAALVSGAFAWGLFAITDRKETGPAQIHDDRTPDEKSNTHSLS